MNSPPASSDRSGAGELWAGQRRILLALRARLSRGASAHRKEADELLNEARDDHTGRVADDNEIETLLAEAKGELHLLDEVESALLRIDAGTYGTCEMTGLPIPAERLRALPWTRYTREAAERREKRAVAR